MIDLFFSYSHQDESMRNELEIHLAMLKRSGLINTWHDRRIAAGAELHHEVSEHLESADVILLLLSPYFLASDYCYETEAQRALQRHAEKSAIVIPVILQPCDWLESPFGKLRATPQDGKPIAKFPNVHDAFLQVTQDIRAAATTLGKADKTTVERSPIQVPTTVHSPRSSNLRLKKSFSDRDQDEFVDNAYAYIANFFENSLAELSERNPGIEFRYKQLTGASFTAAVYVSGKKRTGCHVWLSGRNTSGGDIAYSANDSAATTGINESLRVEADGYQLGLKTLGLSMARANPNELLTQHGAAEYLWAYFISPLQ